METTHILYWQRQCHLKHLQLSEPTGVSSKAPFWDTLVLLSGEKSMDFSQSNCGACHLGAPSVTPEEHQALMQEVPMWTSITIDGVPQLQRHYTFKNFAQALAFTNALGDISEAQDHHPAILTQWGKVTVNWWTHTIKGLHKNDFIMAAKTDTLFLNAKALLV